MSNIRILNPNEQKCLGIFVSLPSGLRFILNQQVTSRPDVPFGACEAFDKLLHKLRNGISSPPIKLFFAVVHY